MPGSDKESTPEPTTASVDPVWRLAALMPRRFRALVIFAAFTGLRWGELVALRVRYVDLDTGVVHVVRKLLSCRTANGFRAGRSQMPVSAQWPCPALGAGGGGARAPSRDPAERSGGPDLQWAEGGGVAAKQLPSISALARTRGRGRTACGRRREHHCLRHIGRPRDGNQGSRHHRDGRDRSDHQLTRGAEDRVRDEGMRNGIRSELHRDPGDGRVPEGLGYRQCCHHAPGSRSGRNWRRSHRSEPAIAGTQRGSSRGVPQSHQHEAGRRSIWPSRSICASNLYARPQLWTPHGQAHDDELRRVWLSTSYRATPVAGTAAPPVKGQPDKNRSKPRASGTHHTRGTGQSAEGFVTLRSEDRDSTRRVPTVWDALFGCVRAARVQVETAHRRLVTRERMAVLCRGSND
jgi:hypothetical protein